MSRADNETLHTVLGLQSRRGPVSLVIKLVLYLAIGIVFAGPLFAVLAGAFSKVPTETSFSLWPDGFTLDNFRVAGHRDVYRYLLNSFIVVGFGLLLQMV